MKKQHTIIAILFWIAAIYNIIYIMLFVCDILFLKVDFFLLDWMGAIPLFATLPIGLIGIGYVCTHLKNKNVYLLLLFLLLPIPIFFVIYAIPSCEVRIPTAMVQHFESEGDQMKKIAEYTNALLPDSTYIHYTKKGEILTLATFEHNKFQNPNIVDFNHFYSEYEQDSVLAATHITKQHLDTIKSLLRAAKLDAIEVYKDEFVQIPFVSKGFATWFFEIPFTPYSNEQMQLQEKAFDCLPISAELNLRFHSGGPSSGEPFPFKEQFMNGQVTLTKRSAVRITGR